MPYTLVAAGDASSLANLGQYENKFGEGDYGRLDLNLTSSVAADIVSWLDEKLDTAGVPEHKLTVDGRTIHIHFKKEIAPLAIIVAAIAAVFLLWGLVIAWQLWRMSPAKAIWTIFGIPILIIAIVVAAIILIVYIGGRVTAGPVVVSAK